MSKPMKRTLIAIALFFLSVIGSFIWFVATWDKTTEQPVSAGPAATHLAYASDVHGMCMGCDSRERGAK